ncbi:MULTISPECIES: hypothetical protein [unclassified Pedobacter]|uniref:hypothetical protein n=1 Tax=Pedobacter TaxID=84567 RepID=UPI000B4C0554|nr:MULTISPECIES: hypothetical protein [unclassified Pedobacter]MCX2429380.1 hypothetical protein [Pedobacter sp. GR22-10]MCX2584225.1 hypothetical protein [Pedobacter sp. MR22-3]OWK70978.1 hypothetical protein CBW18_07785 [Pedobacter sp. AJM]
MSIEIIAKEHIGYLNIIEAKEDQTTTLKTRLNEAQRLGNEFKSKAIITFNTTIGPKRVDTTVWSVTEKYIQLKNNIHIPLKSLIDIEF